MLEAIDQALFRVLNRGMGNRALDVVMPVITGLHHTRWFFWVLGLFAVGVLALGSRRARLWLLCAIVAVGVSDLLCARVVKRIVPRDRPCHTAVANGPMSFPETRLVGPCPGSASFPSNHASNMMALGAVCLWFTRGRKRWAWLLLPLVIGYSRIYLGYHYPFDVLGGWALGALVGFGVVRTLGRLTPAGGGAPRAEPPAPA